jgi:VanZ family protein
MRALNSFHLSDTVEHFCAYACLVFLPALHERRPFILLAATGAILLGVSLEFAQHVIGGRYLQISDMEANTAGAFAGLLMGIPMRSLVIPPSGVSK